MLAYAPYCNAANQTRQPALLLYEKLTHDSSRKTEGMKYCKRTQFVTNEMNQGRDNGYPDWNLSFLL